MYGDRNISVIDNVATAVNTVEIHIDIRFAVYTNNTLL